MCQIPPPPPHPILREHTNVVSIRLPDLPLLLFNQGSKNINKVNAEMFFLMESTNLLDYENQLIHLVLLTILINMDTLSRILDLSKIKVLNIFKVLMVCTLLVHINMQISVFRPTRQKIHLILKLISSIP